MRDILRSDAPSVGHPRPPGTVSWRQQKARRAAMKDYQTITLDLVDDVAVLCLNRPDRRTR